MEGRTHLLTREVINVDIDVTPLSSNPRPSMHLGREVDLAVPTHEHRLGSSGHERLESGGEEDGGVEVGEDLDVSVEMGDGSVRSTVVLELDRTEEQRIVSHRCHG